MSLADSLDAEAKKALKNNLCTVAKIMLQLDAADIAALQEHFAGETRHAAIARALKANGHDVSSEVVGRHRRKECTCERFR